MLINKFNPWAGTRVRRGLIFAPNILCSRFHSEDGAFKIRRLSVEPREWKNYYAAIVVGGGPAGIATVGNLLEQNVKPILWLGNRSGAGRLNTYYREVPSNTKVKRFLDYADGVEPFRKITKQANQPNAYTVMKDMDQEKTCEISQAADLCNLLAAGLRKRDDVHWFRQQIHCARWTQRNGWHVRSLEGIDHGAQILVLCTGSQPSVKPLPVSDRRKRFDLDTALQPSQLKLKLPVDQESTVGVIGASHSAVLVLRNLYQLASTTHPRLHVKWFTRHPLRYAEEKDGWILRDNTGLKGDAADWAKENLEDSQLPTSPVGKHITKIVTVSNPEGEELEKYKSELEECSTIIQAVGYKADTAFRYILMAPKTDKVSGTTDRCLQMDKHVQYDHETAEFIDLEGNKIKGLYGAGIAYPEKVVDPEGNVEFAVGLAKFMKYLKRVVPDWNGHGKSKMNEERVL